VKGLNFQLAYKRVQDELNDQPRSGRAFVANPFERELVELDLDSWLAALSDAVTSGNYAPGEVAFSGAPKGADLIRPGVHMGLADRVVYTAAVGACARYIIRATRWSQRTVDFAPLFHATQPQKRHWLLKPFVGWEHWTEESLRKLALKKNKYVVTVDIAGYFENVSISRLQSDLLRIESPAEVVELISGCLTHWSLVRDRGLPQGVLASDILAKLYLESFDRRLKDEGYAHTRYVDDIRVFCQSRAEARRALVLVTELLRERGLTVQSAKTKIRVADKKLRREFAGALPAIRALHRDYLVEVLGLGLLPEDEASVPVSVIDDLVNAEPQTWDPAVFRRAFEKFILEVKRPNQSMFRYLLRRFAAADERFAVDYCSRRLRSGPEAVPEILRYFEDLGDPHEFETMLAGALGSRDLEMYPFSRFLILEWFRRNSRRLRAPTLKIVRKQAFGADNPAYVQAAGRAALGRFGNHADLEKIASLLASSHDSLERAQIVCSLGRLEKGRRNALAGRVKKEDAWGARAAKLAKTAV
jgi:hypothetical protein